MTWTLFQSPTKNRFGIYVGIFGLANSLAHGKLTDEDFKLYRSMNDWYNATYFGPSTTNKDVYNPEVNPVAVAWFKRSEAHPAELILPDVALLERYGVTCERFTSHDPGQVLPCYTLANTLSRYAFGSLRGTNLSISWAVKPHVIQEVPN